MKPQGALFSLYMFAVAAIPAPAGAAEWPARISQICERAAVIAAGESGVPADVLRAIALVETGTATDAGRGPWPWTVNMEGRGTWFATRGEAVAYALRHHARGARSFDAGCFQVNYRWHGDAFRSVEHMFDPVDNARYAARFLTRLRAEFGDWSRAAGAYHSRTPRHATRYRKLFDKALARLGGKADAPHETVAARVAADPAPAPLPSPKPNRFPLLRPTGAPAGLGSLVAMTGAERPLIDATGAAGLFR